MLGSYKRFQDRSLARTHMHTQAHMTFIANAPAEEARNGGVMGMGELPPIAQSIALLQQACNDQTHARKRANFDETPITVQMRVQRRPAKRGW